MSDQNKILVEAGHIGVLIPDPDNPRRHNPRNVGMIERSLSETGAGRSVVVDRKGRLIAGNATIEAAAQAGITRAVFVHSQGDQVLVHVRDDLDLDTDRLARKLSMYDNRSAELAAWDTDILAGMEDLDILGDLFTESELQAIIEGEDSARTPPPAKPTVYRISVEFDDQHDADTCLQFLADAGYEPKKETA